MVAICLKGQCSEGALPEGTLPGDPVAGDCLQPKCLGNGAVISVANDTDVPADDGSPCTEEVCVGGEVAYGDAAPGTACGTNGVCNDQGQCVGCLVDADCPGVAGVCGWPVCTDGACGWTNLAEGTALPDDGTGDCRIPSCNGQGVEVWVTSTTDIPPDDLNPCTVEGCSPEGALLADPAPIGASCAYNGGALCDGAGNCVECVQNADCAAGVCTNHVCVPAPCADNTKNGDETDTDCGGSCPPCGAGKALCWQLGLSSWDVHWRCVRVKRGRKLNQRAPVSEGPNSLLPHQLNARTTQITIHGHQSTQVHRGRAVHQQRQGHIIGRLGRL